MREEVLTFSGGLALLLMLVGTVLSGVFMLAPYSAGLSGLWIGILATSLLGLALAVVVTTVSLLRAIRRPQRPGTVFGASQAANDAGSERSYAAAA